MALGNTLPENGRKGAQLSASPHCSASSESNRGAVDLQTDLQFQGREEPAASGVPGDSPLLLRAKESWESTDEDLFQGSREELQPPPQFCSKHQRWVKTILQECPEDCPNDLLRQANPSASPLLFHSSSSRPSSQDLTPSDLVPCAAHQRPPASGSSSSPGSSSKSQPLLQPAETDPGPQIPPLSQSSPPNVPAASAQHTRLSSAVRQTPSAPAVVADDGGAPRAPLRFSLASQAVLLRSKLLQPRVSLTRLSSQHCLRATGRRSSTGGTRTEEGGDAGSSFDLNLLYSSRSSSSSGDDSTLWDPDYQPFKKKRLLAENEAPRNLV